MEAWIEKQSAITLDVFSMLAFFSDILGGGFSIRLENGNNLKFLYQDQCLSILWKFEKIDACVHKVFLFIRDDDDDDVDVEGKIK